MPEDQASILEGGAFGNLALDGNANPYVPDWGNNRVVRHDDPFGTDTIADDVWGQDNFEDNLCNKGRGVGYPDAASLCFFRGGSYNGWFVGGVAIDSHGNLWVGDGLNNRVLRFPTDVSGQPMHTADLVLGQPNFTSWEPGSALNQMKGPTAVRVATSGTVYVADTDNSRVLVFDPPLASGMPASRTLGSGFRYPNGLELDPGGGIWVGDMINNQLLLFVNGTVNKVLFKDVQDNSGTCGGNYTGDGSPFYSEGDNMYLDSYNLCDPAGSVGIDSDSNILAASRGYVQDVWRFPAPIPTPRPGIAHSADARIFKPYQFAWQNETGPAGTHSPRGVVVAAGQLIVADPGRLLFWNNPPNLTNGQQADGYVGAPNPFVQFSPHFGRIRADRTPRLWAIRGDKILVYSLPLITGATSVFTLTSPLPILGGGTLSWDSNSRFRVIHPSATLPGS